MVYFTSKIALPCLSVYVFSPWRRHRTPWSCPWRTTVLWSSRLWWPNTSVPFWARSCSPSLSATCRWLNCLPLKYALGFLSLRLSGFLIRLFFTNYFFFLSPGAQGPYPCEGEETHPSPRSAGKKRELRQLLLEFWWRTSKREQEHAQERPCKGQFGLLTLFSIKSKCLTPLNIFFSFPYPGLFQAEPRAVGAGGVLQKRLLPRVWKCI